MSNSRTGRIDARGPDSASEVFIVDHELNRLGSGRGRLQLEVRPGLYKVRFKSATALHDQLVEVMGGGVTEVACPPLEFSSTPPLANTQGANDLQSTAAENASRNVNVSRGEGSSLMIFLRSRDSSPLAFAGSLLRILSSELDEVAELGDGIVEPESGWAALTCALTPGTYILHFLQAGQTTSSAYVTTSKGYQTQVFLTLDSRPHSDNRAASSPRLSDMSVLMAREDEGFNAAHPHHRLAELARQALLSGRDPLDETQVRDLLRHKRETPMLGLLGAFLLLQRRDRASRDLLREVVINLGKILPDHPDVAVLNLRTRRRSEASVPSAAKVLARPPMFWKSWKWVVSATSKSASRYSAWKSLMPLSASAVPAGIWFSTTGVPTPLPVQRPAGDKATQILRMGRMTVRRKLEELMRSDHVDFLTQPRSSSPSLNALEQYLVASAAVGRRHAQAEEFGQFVTQVLKSSPAPMEQVGIALNGLLDRSIT